MKFDVLIVGAGPAGLATAIKLATCAKENSTSLKICVLEKGATVGAHLLSGAVFETRALDELLPNWQALGAPLTTKVTADQFLYLTKKHAIGLPMIPSLKNHGNYIISLGALCNWLAQQAEQLGVEIFPGFPADKLLFNQQQQVIGISTKPVGIGKNHQRKAGYQPAIAIHAKYTVLAEGARGHLTKQAIEKFNLSNADPATYALGVKELWEVPKNLQLPGHVLHTVGWPLTSDLYGGSFVYQLTEKLIALGIIVGLDFSNPYFSPFQELQRFKHHPTIKALLTDGRRIAYGARALNEGGIQALPQLFFPGGLLVGCAAGFLNVAKFKGNHTAMKSGMIAAETIFAALQQSPCPVLLDDYQQNIQQSWLWQELYKARNIRPAFRYGMLAGMAYSALDNFVFRGQAPWTLHIKHHDHQATHNTANQTNAKKINYPPPDNKISFDLPSSLYLANVFHEEDQPCHLHTKDYNLENNLAETNYCPAGVYEARHINAQNCLHCKACDIKAKLQNIDWTPPEGGGGPAYDKM